MQTSTLAKLVPITSGPLSRAEGILERRKNDLRVVLRLDMLARSVSVEMVATQIERRELAVRIEDSVYSFWFDRVDVSRRVSSVCDLPLLSLAFHFFSTLQDAQNTANTIEIRARRVPPSRVRSALIGVLAQQGRVGVKTGCMHLQKQRIEACPMTVHD